MSSHDKGEASDGSSVSKFWTKWDALWEKVPGTDLERYGSVTDPHSMNIGLALFGVFLGLLVAPPLFHINVSGDSPLMQVVWVALLLVSLFLAVIFVLRGRGIRD